MSEGRAERAFWLVLPLGLLVLLVFARDATFRYDDWDFVWRRTLTDPIGLFRPYNDEWVATPAVVFRIIFEMAGLSTYLPYLAATLAAHGLAAERLRVLVSRLAGPRSGLASGIVFLFLGTGGEVLDQAIGLGVILPVALGIWALDETYTRGRSGRAATLLAAAVSSHPIGMVFLGCNLLVAPREWKSLRPLVLVALVTLLWAIAFEFPALAARGSSIASAFPGVPSFLLVGSFAAVGSLFGLGLIGGSATSGGIAVVALAIARNPRWPSLVLACLIGLVAEFALIGLSRSVLGSGIATSSRYMYAAVALVIIGLAAWFGPRAEGLIGGSRLKTVAGIAIVGIAIAGNLRWYAIYREVAAEAMYQTRAATAIVLWRPELTEWRIDLFMPPPERFRSIIAQYGNPDHDVIAPWVVPMVPEAIATDMCRTLVPEAPIAECVHAVEREVGQP